MRRTFQILTILVLLLAGAWCLAGTAAPDLSRYGLSVLTDAIGSDGRRYVLYGEQPATQPTAPPTTSPVAMPTTQPSRAFLPKGFVSVNHTANQVVRDIYVKGQTRNIVCQAFAGDLLIDNVVSVDSLGEGQFDGQGIYLDDIRGTTTIQNSYLGYNGRSRLPGAFSPTQYQHHIYFNNSGGKAGRLIVRYNLLAKSGGPAIEDRALAGSEVYGNVILDCGVAIEAIMGGADVHDNLIYGGEFFWDGHGWTGNTAIKSYWPILCRNNIVLTRPHQGDVPKSTAHPTTKAWPQYGINLGGGWSHQDPPWTPPPLYPAVPQYMSGSGNLISPSWPGGVWYSSGNGEKGPGAKLQGWALTEDGPDYDCTPALAKVEAGGSVAEAIATIRAAIKR